MKPKIPGLEQQTKIKTTPSLEVTNLNAYQYQATKSNSEAVQASLKGQIQSSNTSETQPQ